MNEWRPTPKQAEFLALPYSIKEAFYAGAVGAGKSDVLLLYPIIHQFHLNEKFRGLFLRRTYKELDLEIIPRSTVYYRHVNGKYNKNDKTWSFPSGALIFFGHVENEDDVHKYDSAQPNYIAFDELTSFTEWQYLYITLQRSRTVVGSNLPAIVRSASNPGNIGHTWVRKRFIDPAPEGRKIIQSPSGIKRIFIPARITDNPHIDTTYIASLEALPEAERKAKLYGDWSAFEGSVFDEFRDHKYSDEPENAMHVIPKFDIPDWWPRIASIDWGYAAPAMTYVLFGAISPNRQLHIYRELFFQKTKIEEWCAIVKEYFDREEPRTIKMCHSSVQDRGQEHTILQQVSTALGRNVELSNNVAGARVAGKMLVHEYLRWKPKYVPPKDRTPFNDEHAFWLLRNKGEREYRKYLESYVPQEPEVLPKMLIFDKSPEGIPIAFLVQAIKACTYDKVHPQDVAEFAGDDPYDTLRYLVDSAERYFAESEQEFVRVKKREALIQEFEKNQDWNKFYHQARIFDQKEKPTSGVRRYSHKVH